MKRIRYSLLPVFAILLAACDPNGLEIVKTSQESQFVSPKMKDMPPSFASATAIVSLETDCMMAETMGIFRQMGHSSSPLRYLTNGVRRETLSGVLSSEV